MTRENTLIPSVVEAMGSTPLVELSRICKDLDGRLLAKLDYLNPGLSKKDRIARQIIEDAEQRSELKSGQTVVELTSGNTGTGLAIVCGVKGYPFVAVMSKGNSGERARMMRALGAEVVLVDQLPDSVSGQVSGGDLELVEIEAQRLVKERKAFRADQFQLEGNFRAHYLHTGPEFIEQSNGIIQGFCDFVGSGGTFAGCAAAFKEYDSNIQCFVVEPKGAAVLAGKAVTNAGHRIQGGGYSKADLRFLDTEYMDGFLDISDKQAIETARKLAEQEGIFAGFSSGANVAAAIELLKGPLKGKVVATMINDSGLKYLSTDLWAS
ncbi:MAG: cysteine synthase family protein [Candidatus Latescibacteria bacterium]|nr:cysteine synthase family protein [Candidatus Latescibacterota bacterium]MBT4136430.1 cysteine synthase family protein [Candidatus Latescibacterota bacterium]MBT5829593.1 cysteine synthase family protein [Candidatus Latescibacterota bacterium]